MLDEYGRPCIIDVWITVNNTLFILYFVAFVIIYKYMYIMLYINE